MSANIPEHYAQQFTDGIRQLQQQKTSRLRGAVRVESISGADRAFFDQMDVTSMSLRVGRDTDTVITDSPASRRMVTTATYDKASLVDKRDEDRVLNSPVNAFTMSFAAAANRTIDDVIIAALFADAASGVAGAGTESFDSNFQIAAGAAGLTLAKIIEAKKLLMAAENDPSQRWYMLHSAKQLEDVLSDSTITSADYNSVKALVNGEINEFMGFTWIHTERLGVDGASARRCAAYAQDSMLLGVTNDVTGRASIRNDKNDALQVAFTLDVGATRMDEKGVVEILCAE